MTDDPTSAQQLVPITSASGPQPRATLLPERSDFLEGDAPAVSKVADFLVRALPATTSGPVPTAEALVPWICDALLSNHSIKAYGRDLVDFVRLLQAHSVEPLQVTADHQALQAGAVGSRDEGDNGGAAAIGAAWDVPAIRSQGTGGLGDGPGHRRH
jgi:hypothetical protein